MSNETEVTPDLELQQAMEALAAAKLKMAKATEMKLSAARAALARQESEETLRRAKALEDYTSKVKILEDRRAKEDADRKAEVARKENERLSLERDMAELELQQKAAKKREDMLTQLDLESRRIEAEAKQAEAEALRVQVPIVVEPEITAMSSNHPLGRILRPEGFVPVAEPKPVVAVAEILPPTLRPYSQDESQAVAYAFAAAGHRVQAQIIQPFLSRFTVQEVGYGIQFALAVNQTSAAPLSRSEFVEAVERHLWALEALKANPGCSCGN
jgi:hypothetical protein